MIATSDNIQKSLNNSPLNLSIKRNTLLGSPRKIDRFSMGRRSSLKDIINLNEFQQTSNNTSTKIEFHKIDLTDYPFDRFISFLNVNKKERNPVILAVITQYLENTKLFQKFKNDSSDSDLKSIYKILYFCSINMTYLFQAKSKIVFRAGETGDKFYVILKGSVSVLKTVIKNEEMSFNEYFSYLKKLKIEKENHLFKLVLNANLEAYPMTKKEMNELDEIEAKLLLNKNLLKRGSTFSLAKAFSSSLFDTSRMNIDYEQLKTIKEGNDPKKIAKLIQQKIEKINSSPLKHEKNTIIDSRDVTIQKPVIIYTYDEFCTLGTGEFFGDYALQSNTSRSATIICTEDTHFGVLNLDVYTEYLSSEKQKMINREVVFLLDNNLFKEIHSKNFERKYFQLFISEEYSRNTLLFKENQAVEYIYFIKEGEIELSMNKSLIEIHGFTNQLSYLTKFNYPSYSLKSEPKSVMNELSKIRLLKLFIYGAKEIMGIQEVFYGINHLKQAKAFSDKVRVYKISVSNFKKICELEKNIENGYESTAKSKINCLAKRIMEIKNNLLSMIDKNKSYISKMEKIKLKEEEKKPKFKYFEYTADVPLIKSNRMNNNSLTINTNNSYTDEEMTVKSNTINVDIIEKNDTKKDKTEKSENCVILPRITLKNSNLFDLKYENFLIEKIKKDLNKLKKRNDYVPLRIDNLTQIMKSDDSFCDTNNLLSLRYINTEPTITDLNTIQNSEDDINHLHTDEKIKDYKPLIEASIITPTGLKIRKNFKIINYAKGYRKNLHKYISNNSVENTDDYCDAHLRKTVNKYDNLSFKIKKSNIKLDLDNNKKIKKGRKNKI